MNIIKKFLFLPVRMLVYSLYRERERLRAQEKEAVSEVGGGGRGDQTAVRDLCLNPLEHAMSFPPILC